jgi:hypothetical protein
LDTTLSRILLLLVGLTLPVTNKQRSKEVMSTLTDLDLTSITDQAVGSSPFSDLIFKRVYELPISLNPVNVGDQGSRADKDNGRGSTVGNSRFIGVNDVTGDIFTATMNVKSGISGLEGAFQMRASGQPAILGGMVEGVTDDISR